MMKMIDNINTLLGDDLKQIIQKGSCLKIAASCFSIYAFESLKNELEKIDSLEFIFTAPTFLPEHLMDKIKKEHRQFQIPKAEHERIFFGGKFEIQLKNKLTQRAIAKECANWMQKKAKFKSNASGAPMQQFCTVTSGENSSVYLPLQGFTSVDLGYQKGNAISNFINRIDEVQMTKSYLSLFDQIWNDSEKLQDVSNYLYDYVSNIYKENSPARIYFLILYNIFSEFLENVSEDDLPNDQTGYKNSVIWSKLYNFQKDAVAGIINKLESFNGCILADSVGLGKTFSALAVIKYYELRNRSVLVLCPKKLAENWRNYNSNLKTNSLTKDRFSYDVLCHTDLSRRSGSSFGIPLDRVNWGNYDLVVIDESHNFRNNNAFNEIETRYQRLMNEVIRQGVKTKVLMLSATPVNNKFLDLRNQLALAYEGESAKLAKKLKLDKTVEDVFRRAQKTFNEWSEFSPELRTASSILNMLDFDFFKLLDSVTIARSRKHIENFYDTSEIGVFPERLKPISLRSPLTKRDDIIELNDIFAQLKLLKLAVYAPLNFLHKSQIQKYADKYDQNVKHGAGRFHQVDRERSLQALITINLLKRLESSVEAFRITLSKLKNSINAALVKIDVFNNNSELSALDEAAIDFYDLDSEEEDELDANKHLVGGKIQVDLADMDVLSWERELRSDSIMIDALLTELNKIEPKDDAKLIQLKQQIEHKIKNPINPQNKKILIFTAFADTADYLYKHLSADFFNHYNIHMAKVTGGSTNPKSTLNKAKNGKTYDFQSILTLFSPISKEKEAIYPNIDEEIDILIATDCISEGQNLQDCDMVINYDIHWNPVRIIQRFGRIDRIGSRNKYIQLVNYWPDITLDDYINLRERVENRMIIADVTATGDDNVLNAKANDIAYRKEQLRRLQNEVIDLEDIKSGISITDLGLNEFRIDLLNYIKTKDSLDNLPSGMHAVVPENVQKGLCPGVIFALRNHNQSINVNQQNRLHPYYLIYMSKDGTVLISHMEAKKILDILSKACKDYDQPLNNAYQKFNLETQDGRNMELYSQLLSKAIVSMISLKETSDIDSLFSGGKTSALVNTISGLDDFELLAFIIVQEE